MINESTARELKPQGSAAVVVDGFEVRSKGNPAVTRPDVQPKIWAEGKSNDEFAAENQVRLTEMLSLIYSSDINTLKNFKNEIARNRQTYKMLDYSSKTYELMASADVVDASIDYQILVSSEEPTDINEFLLHQLEILRLEVQLGKHTEEEMAELRKILDYYIYKTSKGMFRNPNKETPVFKNNVKTLEKVREVFQQLKSLKGKSA